MATLPTFFISPAPANALLSGHDVFHQGRTAATRTGTGMQNRQERFLLVSRTRLSFDIEKTGWISGRRALSRTRSTSAVRLHQGSSTLRMTVPPNDMVQFPTISCEEANDRKSKGWIHIDVRPEQDYNGLHAPQTENFPLVMPDGSPNPDFLAMVVNAYPDKNKVQLLVSCRSGFRSQAASTILVEAGYKNIVNIEGGIMQWQAKGLPLG